MKVLVLAFLILSLFPSVAVASVGVSHYDLGQLTIPYNQTVTVKAAVLMNEGELPVTLNVVWNPLQNYTGKLDVSLTPSPVTVLNKSRAVLNVSFHALAYGEYSGQIDFIDMPTNVNGNPVAYSTPSMVHVAVKPNGQNIIVTLLPYMIGLPIGLCVVVLGVLKVKKKW